MKKFLIALVIACSAATSANAANLTFDVTWDGSLLTETTSGSGFTGSSINVGDDFTLTVRAAGNGFWTNDALFNSLPINPRIDGPPFGQTTANATSTGFLDGAQVFQDIEVAATRQNAEIGVNGWELPIGLVIDRVVLEYALLATNFGPIVLLDGSFWNNPFPGMTYTVAAVPLPAALSLLGSGLAAMGLLGWRRKRKAA